MIEPYTQKIIFVDEPFMEELKQASITSYQTFEAPDLDTKVITLPLSSSDVSELIRHVDVSHVRPGSVLVKPGYSDHFVTLDEFTDDHAKNKFDVWMQLCVALGAKKVDVTNIEDVSLEAEEQSSVSAVGNAKSTFASGEASLQQQASSSSQMMRQSIMKLKVAAAGGVPDFQAADRIMRQYGVQRETMFNSLYNMRSVESNTLLRHEFSLDMSTDVKKVLNASLKAKLAVMSKICEGRAEFDRVRTSMEKGRTALKLTVVVEF